MAETDPAKAWDRASQLARPVPPQVRKSIAVATAAFLEGQALTKAALRPVEGALRRFYPHIQACLHLRRLIGTAELIQEAAATAAGFLLAMSGAYRRAFYRVVLGVLWEAKHSTTARWIRLVGQAQGNHSWRLREVQLLLDLNRPEAERRLHQLLSELPALPPGYCRCAPFHRKMLALPRTLADPKPLKALVAEFDVILHKSGSGAP